MLHNCVAIVPCRAGSKGLPDKNFLILGSEKLYKIALDQALRCISEVIISSDKNLEKELETYPVDYFWHFVYNHMPHKPLMKSLELLTEKVWPNFTDKIKPSNLSLTLLTNLSSD